MNKNASLAERSTDLFAVAGLLLAISWFCQDLILRGEVPFFRDLGAYFYPLRLSLAESFKTGEIPLWDRRLAQGFPVMAAFQPGVFYPPHFLLGAVPFFLGIRLLFIVHFIIAAVGTYKLIRNWQYPTLLAAIGALMFSLGGTVVSLSNLLNHFQSAVWLPWALLTWEQLLRAPKWRSFLIFTFISTLQFLAGSPEIFVMSLVLVVIDGFRMRSQDQRLSIARIVGLLISAILLLVAISMVQVLATGELFLQSHRQQLIPIRESIRWSLKPLNLLNLFFLDKEIDLDSGTGVRLLLAKEPSFFVTYYMGSLSFLGICFWAYFCSWREKLIGGGLIFGSLLLSFGDFTPVYPFLLERVPWISIFRFPEKFFFLTHASLLFFVIRGLGRIFAHEDTRSTETIKIIACFCLCWIVLYLCGLLGAESLGHMIANANSVASLMTSLERQVLLTIAASLLLYLTKTKKLMPSLANILLAAVVFVDLLSANKGFLFSVPPETILQSSTITIREKEAGNRTFYYASPNDLHASSILVRGTPNYREAVALWFRNLLPNAGIFYGIDYMQEIDALGRQPYTDFLNFANRIESPAQVRLLRAFSVGYVISFRELNIPGITLVGRFPGYFSWLYKIDRPVPRAYIVHKSIVEKEPTRALKRLADRGFDPMVEVILEEDIPIPTGHSFTAKANILRYRNTFAAIETQSNAAGILVFLDSHYPGWKAYVNGKETSIVKANHFYRAIAVPQGQHLVEFKYEPLSFKIGLIISSITLFSILFISLIISAWKRTSLLR